MVMLYWLDRLQSSDRQWVGEKAWMLSQLLQAGYPVSSGFTVSAAILPEFLQKLDNSAPLLADFPHSSLHLDVDNAHSLKLVAQQSRQAILNAPLPAQWQSALTQALDLLPAASLIVRASIATPRPIYQSFSGLIPSQVCPKEIGALELAFKRVWLQLFSAKSLFYWKRAGIAIEQLNLAVLVQPIANAIASGTAAACGDRLEIQSTWGLGHSLLQGEVSPDFYAVERTTGDLLQQHLGNKTRAYRLKNAAQSDRGCLEAYLLSTTEQAQYSLSEQQLSQLSEILQRLGEEAFRWEFLEWTLEADTAHKSPQWSIVKLISAATSPNIPIALPPSDPNFLASGIAASPGCVQAIAQIAPHSSSALTTLIPGRILITPQISSTALAWIRKAAGIVTERGGMTSHAAILARELGIPAVEGVAEATRLIKTGETICLDGNTGKIQRVENLSEEVISYLPPSLTTASAWHYPIGTQLLVNVSQIESLTKIEHLPVDGIGLMRSELMLLEVCEQQSLQTWLAKTDRLEIVEAIAQQIQPFAAAFAPRPLFYRTYDEQSRKMQTRGTASYLSDSTLFELELSALARLQHQGYDNLRLILPFVRSVEEFTFCRERVEQAGLTQSDRFELWLMAEVPSVIFLMPQYVRAGVQGIAIGTNDLIPLLLGIEREDPAVSDLAKPWPPAVLAAIQSLIERSRNCHISCSICGQLPVQSPELIKSLIYWGIQAISVEPEAAEPTYRAIARAEQQILLELAREHFK